MISGALTFELWYDRSNFVMIFLRSFECHFSLHGPGAELDKGVQTNTLPSPTLRVRRRALARRRLTFALMGGGS